MASLSGCSWPTLVVRPPSSFLSSPSPKVLPLACLNCHRRSIFCAASKSATTTEKKELRGIMRPRPISPALQSLVGVPEISRTESLKKIWAYIKENNLQGGLLLDKSSGMPLNILGLGIGKVECGGFGVGLGLGWGFGSAYGSYYRSSEIKFQGVDFQNARSQKDQRGKSFPSSKILPVK